MQRFVKFGVLALAAVGLIGAQAGAQGLGGTRPVRNVNWGVDPYYYMMYTQAAQASREAEQRAELARLEESRRTVLAEQEAARKASAAAATSAAVATAHSINVASQEGARRAFEAYKASAARRAAEGRRQATLPTDLGAEEHLGTAEAKSPEKPPPASADTKGVVALRVPADAEVWFSGYRSHLTGTERSFTTPSLEKGETYTYEVRVRWTENGQPVEQTRQVPVRAGERTVVEFPGGAP